MPRKILERTDTFPYHVTTRTNNLDWFEGPTEQIWNIFQNVLEEIRIKKNLKIHAFVLMSNHIHLLLSTPDSNIDQAMRDLFTLASKKIGNLCGRQNHIFGARYKWSLIKDPAYYSHALKYVLNNPVRAGICRSFDAYRYSVYRGRESKVCVAGPHPFFEIFVPTDAEKFGAWARAAPTVEDSRVKKALRRREFRIPIRSQA